MLKARKKRDDRHKTPEYLARRAELKAQAKVYAAEKTSERRKERGRSEYKQPAQQKELITKVGRYASEQPLLLHSHFTKDALSLYLGANNIAKTGKKAVLVERIKKFVTQGPAAVQKGRKRKTENGNVGGGQNKENTTTRGATPTKRRRVNQVIRQEEKNREEQDEEEEEEQKLSKKGKGKRVGTKDIEGKKRRGKGKEKKKKGKKDRKRHNTKDKAAHVTEKTARPSFSTQSPWYVVLAHFTAQLTEMV